MNERVARLRRESVGAKPSLSAERASLMTEFYRQAPVVSTPVLRALAFKHLLENKEIWIGDGELIVGERGPRPKAAPTYPELCCHSLQDLDLLDSREKIPFAVAPEVRGLYGRELIPFWRGRSIRDRLFAAMTDEWKAAYEAGIFTEFMEQRAPGHTVAGDKIYRKGFLDIIRDIDESAARLGLDDPARGEELKAMRIAAEAIIAYAERHAEKARAMAAAEPDPARRADLLRVAEVCSHVPAHAPRDFHEALQTYWFVHLGVITELNTWDAFNPGRLDQHLHPFYRRGLEDGSLTREQARELLQCFWVKFNNQPAPPKVGVTAAESATYTDFANINLGGLRADGADGVNDVTYLLLEVIDEMRLLQPSTNIQLSAKNPDRFLKAAARVIRQGWGQPSVFNADAVREELLRQGKAIEDARNGGTSGCVEAGAFGKEAYILTGYLNLPKILEIALNDGVDPRTGKAIGLETGAPASFATFDELFVAFRRQLAHFIRIKTMGNDVIERLYAAEMPSPFLSLVIDDCVARGKDYNAGGARYNTSYIQGVGLGSLTDALAAIKRHVFDDRDLAMSELLAALATDFGRDGRGPALRRSASVAGAMPQDPARLRQLLVNKSPKWGNDDDYADGLAVAAFNAFFEAVDGRPNQRGGAYHVDMLPTTCHVYFGSVTGATADGRRAWEPLSEGISPVQGADRRGPTAVLRSAGKLDHVRTGGTLLNQKFSPQVVEGDEGLDNLAHLVRSYFRLGGHHIQFNVVSAATLREAQREPDKHRDLIVRVAGYSDYFCDLTRALQDEIIARTEHSAW